nr:trihelix transcription factor ASR3-like isoform X2 [Ipomoea batatas]
MRDFKKVREYERRVSGDDNKSYWKLERNERKENNLPTNMLREIYEALVEVHLPPPMQQSPLEAQIAALPLGGGGGTNTTASLSAPATLHHSALSQSRSEGEFTHTQKGCEVFPVIQKLSALMSAPSSYSCSDPDTSEHSDSPAKRRRMGEGTSGTQTSGGGNMNSHQEVGPAISRSAALIAEAIQSSEEREERRHRELLSLHERRLQIEESKADINRQGINGLVDAINRLANSILTLATNNNQPGPPPS